MSFSTFLISLPIDLSIFLFLSLSLSLSIYLPICLYVHIAANPRNMFLTIQLPFQRKSLAPKPWRCNALQC